MGSRRASRCRCGPPDRSRRRRRRGRGEGSLLARASHARGEPDEAPVHEEAHGDEVCPRERGGEDDEGEEPGRGGAARRPGRAAGSRGAARARRRSRGGARGRREEQLAADGAPDRSEHGRGRYNPADECLDERPARRLSRTASRPGPRARPRLWDALNLGSAVGDEPGRVEENWRRLEAATGLAFARVRQVHGTRVVRCGRDAPRRRQTRSCPSRRASRRASRWRIACRCSSRTRGRRRRRDPRRLARHHRARGRGGCSRARAGGRGRLAPPRRRGPVDGPCCYEALLARRSVPRAARGGRPPRRRGAAARSVAREPPRARGGRRAHRARPRSRPVHLASESSSSRTGATRDGPDGKWASSHPHLAAQRTLAAICGGQARDPSLTGGPLS